MDSRVGLALIVLALAVTPSVLPNPHPGAGEYPIVPFATADALVSNLSAPTLAPGSSGGIDLELANPFSGAMTAVTLTLELYAFVPFSGNATEILPSGESPVFSSGSPNGSTEALSISQLGPGAEFRLPGNASATVLVPPGAPSGTFSIRVALSFAQAGQPYLLESRGYFSNAQWENATELPGGASTINDSRLGVSGVLPETAILVRSAPASPILYAILGGSIALAAAGGFLAYRRGPGSRSGRWGARDPHKAPSAFGNSRTNDRD